MVNLVMILVKKEMDIITTGVISLKIPILELGQMQIFAGQFFVFYFVNKVCLH